MKWAAAEDNRRPLTCYNTVKYEHLTVDSQIVSIWVSIDVHRLLSDMHKLLYNWNLTVLNTVPLCHITAGYVDQFAVKYTYKQTHTR